jgi:hypothetical protein
MDPLAGGIVPNGQRVLPSTEGASPLWGIRAQVLDSFIVHGENALSFDAHYAAGIATITSYGGAGLAAEFEVRCRRNEIATDLKQWEMATSPKRPYTGEH